jgi:hypothetical protein
MPTYNSDMMHCRQERCKKANQCYRYWLGQHATGLVSMFRPEVTPDECEYFINIKNY